MTKVWNLGSFDDFAGFYALGADAYSFGFTVYHRFYALQIWEEAAFTYACNALAHASIFFGFAAPFNASSRNCLFTAYITNSWHSFFLMFECGY